MPKRSLQEILPNLSLEDEILLHGSRTFLDPEIIDRLHTLMQQEIDWNLLLAAALRHGVASLFYQNLKKHFADRAPAPILDQFRDYFQKNLQRSLLLTKELFHILELLKTQGISAIPVKGPIFAFRVYGDVALREFVDLDIFTRQEDVLRVKDLLLSQGYGLPFAMTPNQEAAYLRYQCEFPLVHQDRFRMVDLEWNVAPRYFSLPINPLNFWHHLESLSLWGRTVPSLSMENYLLYLCVHGTKHCWVRLQWISDVAQLLRIANGIHWPGLLEYVRTTGCRRILFLGLLLAQDLMGTELPDHIQKEIQAEPQVQSLASTSYRLLFRRRQASRGMMKNSLFQILAREHTRDKVKFILRLGLTPTLEDWAFMPLPSSLSFLYLFIRPVRLIKKYGSSPN